ncbi:MAG: hypothetical protein DMG67_08055 [Acidobacteria bacterium]|nr:MAG: hypothetical protein DMG67_08055 [Acidobacteriota bacterium]
MQTSQLMQATQLASNGQLGPDDIFKLSVLATTGLAVMWLGFWIAVILRKESVHEILLSTGFFRTVAVMGVVAATVVLSLAGRLEGNITGAILSGIVGYVLGQLAGRGRGQGDDKKN